MSSRVQCHACRTLTHPSHAPLHLLVQLSTPAVQPLQPQFVPLSAPVQQPQAVSAALSAGPLPGASPASSSTPSVELRVHHSVPFGCGILAVGSVPQLGSWQVARALPLSWTAGDVWVGRVAVPPGTQVEFKVRASWVEMGSGVDASELASSSSSCTRVHRAMSNVRSAPPSPQPLHPMPRATSHGAMCAPGCVRTGPCAL